jgi:hypothetical protein
LANGNNVVSISIHNAEPANVIQVVAYRKITRECDEADYQYMGLQYLVSSLVSKLMLSTVILPL